jgi:hypothetical protein
MAQRTLLTQRKYFGIDALRVRTAAGRVAARITGLPPERASVTAKALQLDFEVSTVAAPTLIKELVAEGMLRPRSGRPDEYRPTRHFLELASARVVDALTRDRARTLVEKAAELAAKINAEWTQNPVKIVAVVPFGAYMSREKFLDELPIALVVRARREVRQPLLGRPMSRSDGVDQIRAAFRGLSSFVRVGVVSDLEKIPRPFAVAYQA